MDHMKYFTLECCVRVEIRRKAKTKAPDFSLARIRILARITPAA